MLAQAVVVVGPLLVLGLACVVEEAAESVEMGKPNNKCLEAIYCLDYGRWVDVNHQRAIKENRN